MLFELITGANAKAVDVDCTTKYKPNHKEGPVSETELKTMSDCAEKHDVATVKVTYALNDDAVWIHKYFKRE